jgi:hypothetical protein
MEDLGMKTATFLAVAIATVTSVPLLAQEVDRSSSANEPAKTTYAPAAGGYGDEAASHAWEMSSVTGELEGKLDSKTAKAGDRVVLKTTDKVQTADGTVIPRGSRLVGHVTEVRAYDKEHGSAQMAIAFDRAELKNGQSIAIYTLIRGVNPSASAMAASNENLASSEDMIGAPMGSGGQGMGGGRSGVLRGVGGTVDETGSLAGGTMERTGNPAGTLSEPARAGLGATENTAVQTAGHGDLNLSGTAHAAAAARAIPHPTGIPGVMLAGNSSSSGLLLASRRNIQFESGTQMQLGIVADR